jgi:hypothetical protein
MNIAERYEIVDSCTGWFDIYGVTDEQALNNCSKNVQHICLGECEKLGGESGLSCQRDGCSHTRNVMGTIVITNRNAQRMECDFSITLCLYQIEDVEGGESEGTTGLLVG